MDFRAKSGTQHPGFQIAPMIDIIFLLLCFFIASQIYSQWETEIDIKLPSAQTGDMPERFPGEVIINVHKDGSVVVNRRDLDSDGLASLLGRIVEQFPGQPVLIRAHKQTEYENVIRILDLCRQADIWNISFATTASEE